MLIKKIKVEIQCTKVKNMSNSGESVHLGTPTAHAQNQLDMSFKSQRNDSIELRFGRNTCSRNIQKY